jgi:AcrR family transcriptional regulator
LVSKNNKGKFMGRKERRLRDQQELKQSMLEAARAIALAEGWSNVTMRKIADRIEYSHAAIYDYFENKEVLLLELVHEGFRLLEADLMLARAQAHDPEEAMRLVAHGYLGFAWRYPELYRLMYGLDGVAFRISEPEKEGLQIEDVVALTVKEVLDSHGWSTEHLADQVNILWGTAHGLVTLTLADRIRGGQAQARQLWGRAIQDMLLAWKYEAGIARPTPLPNA